MTVMATQTENLPPEAPDTRTPPASWEDWVQRFVPITNPDCNDSWNGFLFETYGTELFRVREAARTQPGTVWTLLDCDGRFIIADGMHTVNRFGYFITERAYIGVPCEFTDDDDDDDVDPSGEAEMMGEADWPDIEGHMEAERLQASGNLGPEHDSAPVHDDAQDDANAEERD